MKRKIIIIIFTCLVFSISAVVFACASISPIKKEQLQSEIVTLPIEKDLVNITVLGFIKRNSPEVYVKMTDAEKQLLTKEMLKDASLLDIIEIYKPDYLVDVTEAEKNELADTPFLVEENGNIGIHFWVEKEEE